MWDCARLGDGSFYFGQIEENIPHGYGFAMTENRLTEGFFESGERSGDCHQIEINTQGEVEIFKGTFREDLKQEGCF